MISIVLNNLSKIENEVASKLLDIFYGKQEKVEDGFYESTVFGSESNYDKLKNSMNGLVVGSVHKKIVETPLVFIRAKENPVFCSQKEQGIAFGFTLVNYKNNYPLLLVVVDKDGSKYKYKSMKYDVETNTFVDSISQSKSCADFDKLMKHVLDNLEEDVKQWINKYI
jgi:hypothetical protein